MARHRLDLRPDDGRRLLLELLADHFNTTMTDVVWVALARMAREEGIDISDPKLRRAKPKIVTAKLEVLLGIQARLGRMCGHSNQVARHVNFTCEADHQAVHAMLTLNGEARELVNWILVR